MARTVVRACRSQAMDADAANTSGSDVAVASVRAENSVGAMLTAWERYLVAGYLAGAAASLDHRSDKPSALAKWVSDGESCTAFARKRSRSHGRRSILDEVGAMSARGLRRRLHELHDGWLTTRGTRCDRTARRLRSLAKTTGLMRRRPHSTWNANLLPGSPCRGHSRATRGGQSSLGRTHGAGRVAAREKSGWVPYDTRDKHGS